MNEILDPTRFISAAVVPVVMISACGLLCLALYNRLSLIITRLRLLSRERIHRDELTGPLRAQATDEKHLPRQLEEMFEQETHEILKRARLIRNSLFCLLNSILCMVFCSLAGGLATLWPIVGHAAFGFFICGQLLVVGGLSMALLELRVALEPVKLESRTFESMLDLRDQKDESE